MRKARFLWLSLAVTGCVGHAEGGARAVEDLGVEMAEATELLLQGERPDDVAKAYPSLRISGDARPMQPEPSTGGSVTPKPPQGIGPISTPVEPQPETASDPIKPVRPGGDPVRPEPEVEGPSIPDSPLDPTMDPVEPEPATEGPTVVEPGDDAISMTCRELCHVEVHTECTTVAQDPVLGTGAKARVCTKVSDTVCTHVCEDDPPNA